MIKYTQNFNQSEQKATSINWLNYLINKNITNYLGRYLIGANKGLVLKTLPQDILNFKNKPIIIIFRLIGGLSLLAILGRAYLTLTGYFLYIAYFFNTLFMLYHFYLSYHRIKHIYKLINSEEVEIRNSPLDRFATTAVRAFLCAKGLCEKIQPIGSAIGFLWGTDEILKASGREALFMQYFSKLADKIWAFQSASIKEDNRIMVYLRELAQKGAEGQAIEETINSISTNPSIQELTDADKAELRENLTNNHNTVEDSAIFKNIKEGVDKNNSESSNVIMKKKNYNNSISYAFIPFIVGNYFSYPETLSSMNKILVGVVTITSILLYSFINIVGYFACLYIIKHTDLEKKYPKFRPIIKYYSKTSVIFLIIDVIFVVGTLLLVLGLCLHLLYTNYGL